MKKTKKGQKLGCSAISLDDRIYEAKSLGISLASSSFYAEAYGIYLAIEAVIRQELLDLVYIYTDNKGLVQSVSNDSVKTA